MVKRITSCLCMLMDCWVDGCSPFILYHICPQRRKVELFSFLIFVLLFSLASIACLFLFPPTTIVMCYSSTTYSSFFLFSPPHSFSYSSSPFPLHLFFLPLLSSFFLPFSSSFFILRLLPFFLPSSLPSSNFYSSCFSFSYLFSPSFQMMMTGPQLAIFSAINSAQRTVQVSTTLR